MASLKLYIPEHMKNSISELQLMTMEDDINEIGKKHNIEENQFDFRLTYVVNQEDGFEVGFFIRNAVDLDLTFDVMPMHLVNGRTIIGIQMIDFKKIGVIPAMSVMPCTIKFEKENVYFPQFLENAELKLGVDVEYKVEYTAKTDVINLKDIKNKMARNIINEKITQLPELRIDTFDYSCAAMAQNETGDVDAIVIIRNGYSNDLKLQEMPFEITNETGLLIYHGTFKAPCEVLEARKALLYNLIISKDNLPLSDIDYSRCNLRFK